MWAAASLRIGNRVLIAHNVTVLDNLTHSLDPVARHAHYKAIVQQGHPTRIDLGAQAVEIQDDAWIGCQSVILRGVTIGTGAVVGAGSVVTRDVPPFTLVVGNPAHEVRKLETDEREAREFSHA